MPSAWKWPHKEVAGTHHCSWVDKILACQALQRLALSVMLSTCHLLSGGCLCGLYGITPPSTRGVCAQLRAVIHTVGAFMSDRAAVAVWTVRAAVPKWLCDDWTCFLLLAQDWRRAWGPLCWACKCISGAPGRADEPECWQFQPWKMRQLIPVSGCLLFIFLLAWKDAFVSLQRYMGCTVCCTGD